MSETEKWTLPAIPTAWPAWRPIAEAPRPPLQETDHQAASLLGWCPDEPPDGRKRVIWWEANLKGPGRGGWMDDAACAVRPTMFTELPPDPFEGDAAAYLRDALARALTGAVGRSPQVGDNIALPGGLRGTVASITPDGVATVVVDETPRLIQLTINVEIPGGEPS